MASEYSVNIRLNTAQVKKDLKTIGTEISNLGRKEAKSSKTALSTTETRLKTETQIANLQKRTQAIRNNILRLDLSGAKVSQIKSKLTRADNQADVKKFDLAKKNIALALKELEILKQQTIEVGKQAKTRANTFKFPMGPSSPLNFGSGGQLLPGSGRGRFGTTRGFDFQSALISGGFPLLFGQGPLGALAGGLGGGIGGMFGQMGGFAGGIAATAALQQVTNAVNGVIEFGKGLQDVDGALATVTEKSLFSSEATEKRAEALKKLGKQEELAKLLTQELTIALGKDGLQRVQAVGKASKELARTFGQLGASLQSVLSIVVLPAINALNKILSGFTIPQRFKNFQESLSGADLTRFNQIVTEERGFTKKNLRGGKTKMVQGMLTNKGMSNILDTAIGEGLGGTGSAFTTSTDPTIAENLQKRIDFLNRSLEVGRERAELEKKIADFREKGTELSDADLEKQLQQISHLEKVESLYREIGSTIESGLVNAIEGAIQGTKTLGEVANSVFAQIQRSLIQFGVSSFLGGLPGGFGKFFGGRAAGGPVKAGGSYMVGERGPEMFTPGVSGTITPNHDLGGSTTVVVNVDASGSAVEGDEQQGRELGRVISAAVQSEIVNQKRPGGLLA